VLLSAPSSFFGSSIAAGFPTSVQFFHLQKQKGGRLTTRTAGSTNAVVRAQFVPTCSCEKSTAHIQHNFLSDAFYEYCLKLTDCWEAIAAALDDKVPKVRADAASWLVSCDFPLVLDSFPPPVASSLLFFLLLSRFGAFRTRIPTEVPLQHIVG